MKMGGVGFRERENSSPALMGTGVERIRSLRGRLLELETRLAGGVPVPAETATEESVLLGRQRRLEYVGECLDALDDQVEAALGCLDGDAEAIWPGHTGDLAQAHIIDAEEAERRRLARDIHDGPAQVLANVIFELEYCARLMDRDLPAAKEALAHLEGNLRAGLSEVRCLIFDLHVPSLGELGLAAALGHYVQEYQSRFRIGVSLRLEALPAGLPATVEVPVFRVIQEALQNVQRHAAATEVTIEARRDALNLVFTVADNGRGFDPGSVSAGASQHLGIAGMKERAALARGRLEVSSDPGRGTVVTLTVPHGQRP